MEFSIFNLTRTKACQSEVMLIFRIINLNNNFVKRTKQAEEGGGVLVSDVELR